MLNVHEDRLTLFQSRWTLSYLCGPLGRDEIQAVDDESAGLSNCGLCPWRRVRNRWLHQRVLVSRRWQAGRSCRQKSRSSSRRRRLADRCR
jgi:hypothetical protein